jgi:hypothetical protein
MQAPEMQKPGQKAPELDSGARWELQAAAMAGEFRVRLCVYLCPGFVVSVWSTVPASASFPLRISGRVESAEAPKLQMTGCLRIKQQQKQELRSMIFWY